MFLLAGAAPVAVSSQQRPSVPTSLVFDGATVVDVEYGKLVPDQRVVIAGNRIRAVGDVGAVAIPRGAQVVAARGNYLIPGLWDMHVHPALEGSLSATEFFYPLFIANGITGIRDAGSMVPLDTLIRLRREILTGARIGPPRQILSGPQISEEGGACRATSHQLCISDPAAAYRAVDSLRAAGADMVKTYTLSKELYFAIAAEARRIGIPFGGHISAPEVTASEASDSGVRIIDHLNLVAGGLDTLCWGHVTLETCRPVAERFRRHDTWWVPTLVARINYDPTATPAPPGSPTLRVTELMNQFLKSGVLPQGNWLRDSATVGTGIANAAAIPPNPDSVDALRTLEKVGLPMVAGSDAVPNSMIDIPPGFSLHAELAVYVANGMTSAEALRTATLNPAKFLHATDSLGTVARGKLADLVLLDADPLADITNTTTIRAVVADGRYLDRAALDKLLADAQANRQEP